MGSTASTSIAEGLNGAQLGGVGHDSSLVVLNVYDLNEDWLRANNIFGDVLKIGGAFHAGVEIHGREWSFGQNGVAYILPRKHEVHVFRQSIVMGVTNCSLHQVASLIERDFTKGWEGPQYDLFRRNCCTFADALCQRLTGQGIPSWVDRFPKIASVASSNFDLLVGFGGSVGSSVASASGSKSGLSCSASAPTLQTVPTKSRATSTEASSTVMQRPEVMKATQTKKESAVAKEDNPVKPAPRGSDARPAVSSASAETCLGASEGVRWSVSLTCKRPSCHMNPGAEMCRRPATRFKV